MNYNIIDIVSDKLTDTNLRKIINNKLYKVIELTEFEYKVYP